MPSKGHYAEINGLNIYYEIHGKGKPLVLLHGGFSSVEGSFAKLIPKLSKRYKVIAIEQQGHGHTVRTDGRRHRLAAQTA